MKTAFSLSLLAIGLLSAERTFADIKLPTIFSDHMVFARAAKVPVWGVADPGEEVSVTLEKQTARAVADKNGKWEAVLDLAKSGQGQFKKTCTNTI